MGRAEEVHGEGEDQVPDLSVLPEENNIIRGHQDVCLEPGGWRRAESWSRPSSPSPPARPPMPIPDKMLDITLAAEERFLKANIVVELSKYFKVRKTGGWW